MSDKIDLLLVFFYYLRIREKDDTNSALMKCPTSFLCELYESFINKAKIKEYNEDVIVFEHGLHVSRDDFIFGLIQSADYNNFLTRLRRAAQNYRPLQKILKVKPSISDDSNNINVEKLSFVSYNFFFEI